ncbi:MAG: hypothetical protein RL670_52 [Actinomycetota bacterium]|jgi:peptidoglycan/xylan/chitin deacetylase (PgdA/CDA1 family)
MDRRQFLLASAAGMVVPSLGFEPEAARADGWPRGCITVLPKSHTRRLAWTVDDGSSAHALKAYLNLLEAHPDLRLTFFVLSSAPAWHKYRRPITELITAGQAQVANHTRGHINLVRASNSQIARQLRLCNNFIEDNFGVNPGPYWRPPYGYIDKRVMRVAADHGFTKPVLWYGSTGAASYGSGGQPKSVWHNCQKWMTNGRIVIDHANSSETVVNFSRILPMLRERKLATVTIADALA